MNKEFEEKINWIFEALRLRIDCMPRYAKTEKLLDEADRIEIDYSKEEKTAEEGQRERTDVFSEGVKE